MSKIFHLVNGLALTVGSGEKRLKYYFVLLACYFSVIDKCSSGESGDR